MSVGSNRMCYLISNYTEITGGQRTGSLGTWPTAVDGVNIYHIYFVFTLHLMNIHSLFAKVCELKMRHYSVTNQALLKLWFQKTLTQ